jgi:hypothetical protein
MKYAKIEYDNLFLINQISVYKKKLPKIILQNNKKINKIQKLAISSNELHKNAISHHLKTDRLFPTATRQNHNPRLLFPEYEESFGKPSGTAQTSRAAEQQPSLLHARRPGHQVGHLGYSETSCV